MAARPTLTQGIGLGPFRWEAMGGPLGLLGGNIDQLHMPVHIELRNSAYKAP